MNPDTPKPIDFTALGVPAGRYALPTRGALEHLGDDTARRLAEYFTGRLPLSALTAAETAFLRDHFLAQATARREETRAYFDRHVPRRYAHVVPDERAVAWAQNVTRDPHATKSLLAVGPTGSGKTHFAYSALAAVAETGARMPWKAVTEADLFARLRPRPNHDPEAEFDKLAKCPLLLLDDLGAAKLSEWTEEITYRLVNHRYEQCLPSIFTSNVLPRDFTDRFGERVTSRLAEMCDRIAFKGDDLRKAGQA